MKNDPEGYEGDHPAANVEISGFVRMTKRSHRLTTLCQISLRSVSPRLSPRSTHGLSQAVSSPSLRCPIVSEAAANSSCGIRLNSVKTGQHGFVLKPFTL
ncbi:hypothetical protein K1719_022899 [Acacia pycnantha]|nr:hypothetical protein K1719_022899 [Acacia pycnantha]